MNGRQTGQNDAIGKDEIFSLFAAHVSSGKAAYFKKAGIDFVMGRREGPYIWDVDGKTKLINCHSNGGVFNLGHRNPEIVQALVDSVGYLDIGNHHLVSEQRAKLAKMLADLTPGDLTRTVFGVGGGEAVDLAIKIARAYTNKYKVISAKGGYHGHTGFALATGDDKYKAPFGPMAPGFVQVPFNDVAALTSQIDNDTAAIILETIPATLGIAIPDDDYFQHVRKLCDETGVVLIIDEVQSGLGRTGRLWGIEHFGIVPDIMVIGKGLSGGIYPLSATIFREKYERVFIDDPFIHISTFGGAEIGCLVAMKVLEITADEAFLRHVEEIAGIFSTGFAALTEKHSRILLGLRQKGMMMGIEMINEHCGPIFTKACFENGLLCIFSAHDPRVNQLLPPLTITAEEAAEILGRLDRSFLLAEQMLSSQGVI